MPKDLIIVESPAKVKTISKFLGKDYVVDASVGHVRDLPTRELGVDEEHNFAPHYEVIQGKQDVVKRLQSAAKKAGTVYLAPDPDREGEAIAWHVAELLKKYNDNIRRIQFNEITARAVKEALENAQELNENLFDSQQARRILDRLVGYKISPILWKNVKRGISAGRVQSVALKILVEREKERRAFRPDEYWPFKVLLAGENPPPFWMDLHKLSGKAVKPGVNHVSTQTEAESLEKALTEGEFKVDSVQEKQRKRSPLPPYITSTLQQDANRRMGFSAKRTMSIAQRLYEGVELGARGTTALITYMRTDSVRIAKDAQDAAKELILDRFGADYYPSKTRNFKTKGGAQDAHEAIRPVDVAIAPEDVKQYLPAEQYKLYRLIWQRFVASQMAVATFWDTTVLVAAPDTIWRAKGERMLFAGFLAAMDKGSSDDDTELPKLKEGDVLALNELKKEQKFTQPPPRYSEASLVKTLEELGIGRPSTYAAIISTLLDREYAIQEEKRFVPTELGFTVSDQLSEHFKALMDVGFTAGMESDLDDVAEGKKNWEDLLKSFGDDFYPTLEKARTGMARTQQVTDIMCENCGKPMAVKFGKTGEFLGCTGFPACRTIKNFSRDEQGEIHVTEREKPEDTGVNCEKCGRPMAIKQSRRGEFLGCTGYPDCKSIVNFTRDEDGKIKVVESEKPEVVGTCPDCGGELLLKKARTGSRFIACSNYPDCTYAAPFSTGVPCPREGCEGELVEKSSRRGKLFYSCSTYPKCDYAVWNWPINEACPECKHPVLTRKTTKDKGEHIACPKKGCGYTRPVDEDA
ncbi:type I DNA topoisomerase [Pseudodesulfovibrio portus]|jgi:DNA topoisomerase-1|uniref:DNA topoisomerase 1 n=1 Tax=Pseudodesulfovibrio portus TaxID=231439 RepID=A0ABN6RU98_9BACT|nr:type I DNA topoisomerase [Pseudodesulfovibrio portus]BDQ34631.1 DNA topoisomerase 1 [Pseudodesulfovibrio portus]